MSARRIVVETFCQHGEWLGPHCTKDREGSCPYPSSDRTRECYCQGGSRRELEPGEFVLIEKVDGKWPEVAFNHELVVGPLMLEAIAHALAQEPT